MEKFKGQTLPACCDFTTLPSGALQSPIQPSFGGNLKSSSPKLNFNSAFQISTKQSYRFKRPCEIVFHFTSSFPMRNQLNKEACVEIGNVVFFPLPSHSPSPRSLKPARQFVLHSSSSTRIFSFILHQSILTVTDMLKLL